MVHFDLGFIQVWFGSVVVTVTIVASIPCEDVRPFNWGRDSERRRQSMGGGGVQREERNEPYEE